MKRIILALPVLAVAAALSSCGVDQGSATRSLNAMGITNVKLGGYAIFGCGEKDTFRSTFTGIGANGQPVEGVVCSGMFKGVTVRFD
jgi:hypothetical protein